jgi:hypothetical protein
MAWTAPVTIIAGTLISAGWANTHVRDNTLDLHQRPINRCSAWCNVMVPTAASGAAVISLITEDFDSNGMHTGSASTIVVPTGGGGTYWFSSSTIVRGVGGGTGAMAAYSVRKNGSAIRTRYVGTHDGQYQHITVTDILSMNAGDTLDIQVSCNSIVNHEWGDATPANAVRLSMMGPMPPV